MEIRVHVADYRPTPGGGTFTWRRLKKRATSLKEAKQLASDAFDSMPQLLGDTT